MPIEKTQNFGDWMLKMISTKPGCAIMGFIIGVILMGSLYLHMKNAYEEEVKKVITKDLIIDDLKKESIAKKTQEDCIEIMKKYVDMMKELETMFQTSNKSLKNINDEMNNDVRTQNKTISNIQNDEK